MKLPVKTSIAAALAIAALAPATPALGYSFSLGLTGPSTGTVGQPMIIQAAGVNPNPVEYWFGSWLEVDAISGGVLPACPAKFEDASQVAINTGGQLLAFSTVEAPDMAGNFSNTVAFTPKSAGTWLICGYTDDGATNTLARSQLTVNVAAAPAPAAAATPAASAPPPPATGAPAAAAVKPANGKAPRVMRSKNKLFCDPGEWSGASGSYAYRWLVAGKSKKGAASKALRVTRGLRGRRVQCSVTASNAAGATTAVSRGMRVR